MRYKIMQRLQGAAIGKEKGAVALNHVRQLFSCTKKRLRPGKRTETGVKRKTRIIHIKQIGIDGIRRQCYDTEKSISTNYSMRRNCHGIEGFTDGKESLGGICR